MVKVCCEISVVKKRKLESDLRTEKIEHKDDVECLNIIINDLTQENQMLGEDNSRLKSIIKHDRSNTSLPSSTDQKDGKTANTYNEREKSKRKVYIKSLFMGTLAIF